MESAKQPGPGWTGRHCPALRLRQARASRARASLAAAPVSTTTAQFGAQHKPFRCRRGPYETGFNLGHHTHTPVDANANTRGGGATPQRRATPLPPPFFFCAPRPPPTRQSRSSSSSSSSSQNTQPLWVGRPAGEASDGHSRQKKNGTTKRGLPKIGHQHTPCGARTGGHGGSGARPGVKRP